MNHIVYVLKSNKDNNFYIGCTSDLDKRLKEHNNGRVLSTKYRIPFSILYSEEFASKYEAFRTEKFYKTPKGKKILKDKIRKQGCGIV